MKTADEFVQAALHSLTEAEQVYGDVGKRYGSDAGSTVRAHLVAQAAVLAQLAQVAAVLETRNSVSVAAPSEASRSLLPTPATAEPESGEKAEGAAAQGFQRPPRTWGYVIGDTPGDGRHAR